MIGAGVVLLVVALVLVVVVLALTPLLLWFASREPAQRKDNSHE